MVSLCDNDKSYFGVDPEFLASRCEYLISHPFLLTDTIYQVPLIMGSSIMCVRPRLGRVMKNIPSSRTCLNCESDTPSIDILARKKKEFMISRLFTPVEYQPGEVKRLLLDLNLVLLIFTQYRLWRRVKLGCMWATKYTIPCTSPAYHL